MDSCGKETYNAMNKSVRMLALLAVGLALVSTLGCDKLRARDQLNKGVLAFKNAKYEEAIDKFQNAVALDPSHLGNLITILGTVIATWLVKSPQSSAKEKGQA